jgi:nucleoside-diphosphate-sugar epimerase
MTSEPTKAILSVAQKLPYRISFGGTLDFQFADDVAKAFIAAATVPFTGAGSYNLRGAVIDVPTFCRTLAQIAPDADRLVSCGTMQLPIAPSLDDLPLQRDFGPLPPTPLAEGVRRTLRQFQELLRAGRLTTSA